MGEFSKFLKIVLLIDIAAGFFYGILYLFIPEIYANLIESPSFSLHFWRLWGGTCLLLGIIGIIGFFRNEWTTFRIVLEFVILWLIMMDIINLISLSDPTHTAISLASEIVDIIVIFGLIAINTFAYFKENKL